MRPSLRRLGWVPKPSPLESREELAEALGLSALWVKRDDKIAALGGGSKVRKLDVLLADPLYRDHERWHATGAIGSGHLVACAHAAKTLGHRLIAHACDQPLSLQVRGNLARTAADADTLLYYPSRAHLLLKQPQLFWSSRWHGDAIIAPGGSCAAGTAGFVLAAFELCDQFTALGAALPDRIYLPFGSGGAAVGLAVGLALAGASSRVCAVSTVERFLVPPGRIAALRRGVLRWLGKQGVEVPCDLSIRLSLDFEQLGAGYAHPTEASMRAVGHLDRHGLGLEPVYTGKAMAAMQAAARSKGSGHWLFWHTSHGLESQPPSLSDTAFDSGALPLALRRRLQHEKH